MIYFSLRCNRQREAKITNGGHIFWESFTKFKNMHAHKMVIAEENRKW
jgi:hypothetical protein